MSEGVSFPNGSNLERWSYWSFVTTSVGFDVDKSGAGTAGSDVFEEFRGFLSESDVVFFKSPRAQVVHQTVG